MRKLLLSTLMAALTAAAGSTVRADDIQFTTLPSPVQTTVIRETHIQGPASVSRIVHDTSGIYAVTVRGDAGEQIVYVNEAGAIVQAPATSTTTTVVKSAQPAVESQQTVTTYQEVQKNGPRYELLEKKGNKEIYLDHQTGQKVTIKREND
jgi:hypothetical protein